MTTISLHKYHDQINQLLEDSQYTLAASHCRYILQQYPRHVDTYRLLAKTLIEQGEYRGATELFQRVLSANPNDFIAHAGLSVIYREDDVLSQAIWHMERAYEIEPYNGAIQQELKNLYIDYSEQKAQNRQDSNEVDALEDLPLTEGALARLYIQGELYSQAIDVLRGALAEDEDRIDLEVLLAEALWRDNQRVAAVQICLQVLDKLPNCITVNAILAEIWLQTGRTEEAQAYLEELQALTLLDTACQDLESPEGSAFQPEGAIKLPAVFEVERMGDEMSAAMAGESFDTPEEAMLAAEDEDSYQWLEGLGDEMVVTDEKPSSEEPVTTMTDSDWLRRELEASEEETAVSDDLSEWLDDVAEAAAEEGESSLDPLAAMTAGIIAADVISDQLRDDDDIDLEDGAIFDAIDEDDDSFDWLNESLEEDAAETDKPIIAQQEQLEEISEEEVEEMPDWLADMSGDALKPVSVDPGEATIRIEDHGDDADDFSEADDVEDDMFDWLQEAVVDESVEELDAGELDLSQFAEFGEESEPEDDGEVVWRLTDELNPPEEDAEELDGQEPSLEESVPEELDALAEFDFELSVEDTGELDDIPDWLLGSKGTDELDADSDKEKAGSEIADELAEWVAANQPDVAEGDDLSDLLSGEVEETAADSPAAESVIEPEEEDDFFTSDLPGWMVESSADIDDSTPLDSAVLSTGGISEDESGSLAAADLPDWLMGESMDLDDSGFLETGALAGETEAGSVESSEIETSEDIPDWLVGEAETIADGDSGELLAVDDTDEEEEDESSKTAVSGGMLGAAAAGLIAKELLDDDDETEDQPEQLEDSSLEEEGMEVAVSEKQDDSFGSQDEPEKPDSSPQEESDEFDWLDDLEGASLSAQDEPFAADDLGDDLDWMDLGGGDGPDDLNLDDLLGLETEEAEKPSEDSGEDVAEPELTGLSEDESLDWLDALADDEPEVVDEMPTWQWPEDENAEGEPSATLEEQEDLAEMPDLKDIDDEEIGAIFSDEPDEADLVEDLDDAMAWLEDLAAEPDAPVEELPSIAEDMELEALFDGIEEPDGLDDLSSESMQPETIDELIAADTQNDSWLAGLGEDDSDPMPDFLDEDLDMPEYDEMPLDEEAALDSEEAQELIADAGEPPEDLDDAMAWLEQLAARQGAPLDELPSVEDEETEKEGIGAAEVVAGAAAIGAINAILDDEDEPVEAISEDNEDEETKVEAEFVAEAAEVSETDEDIADFFEGIDDYVAEDDILAMEVPDDPDEAMAWLEKLAARQGTPLDELPTVSEEDVISTVPATAQTEAETDDSLADVDEAMAWLEDYDEEDDTPELVAADEADVLLSEELSAELDWLESEVDLAAAAAYDADSLSVSDDELEDALEKVALLAVADTVIDSAVKVDDEVYTEQDELIVTETPVDTDFDIPTDPDEFVEQMPDDPDQAMIWLEKLAARQGAPLDELPTVEEDEYEELAAEGLDIEAEIEADVIEELVDEPLVDDIFEIDESLALDAPDDMDMDDAMAWLEKLAARQGTSLDELPTVDDAPVTDEDLDTPDWIAQQTGPLDASLLDEPLVDEAVDQDLSDETVEPDDEESTAEEIIADIEDMDTDDAMALPDDMDMDDAMAWLERLAARQGTSLDELPTVEGAPETEEDIDTPDWIAQQTGPLDPDVIEALDMPEVSDETLDLESDDDFFAALDEVPAIEGIETESSSVDAAAEGSALDMEDIDDSLPDWLDGGEEGDSTPLGHTGWLNTLDDPDMDGWLTAEAEASHVSDLPEDMPEAVDTDSLLSTGGLEDTGGLRGGRRKGATGELKAPDEPSTSSMFTTELDEAQVLADLDLGDYGIGLDQAQLESARNALASGDIEVALRDYQTLVEAGESMHTVISDLERASELYQDKPMVRRMLGDAYMRNGQINKAIETYREALDHM